MAGSMYMLVKVLPRLTFSSSSVVTIGCFFIQDVSSSRLVRRRRISSLFGDLRSRRMPSTNVEASGAAKVLSGTQVAKDVRDELTEQVKKLKAENPGFVPGLAVVQVGDREDSNVYIRMKMKLAQDIGINPQHIKLPRSTTQEQLIETIDKLNRDVTVHGIIVQMPPESDHPIDGTIALNSVSPLKDVDGLNTENAGRVARGELTNCFLPCTPNGCMELIKRTGVPVEGSRAVVLGRSKIVGAPMHDLLLWNHATVTVCHSKTKDLPKVVSEADILVVAIGRPEMVRGDWVKEGAVVIDCGINPIPDATKKSGQRLVGDVHYEEVSRKASHITPVPGGVGPMTVAMLMKNTVLAASRAVARKSE